MNRIERLTAILLLLQDKPRTSEQIARRFEVSKRTVLRDMQALSEMGAPVIAREGSGGGYSLPADYQLAPLALTAHESFLLLLALNALSQLSDTPFARERVSLVAKLRALVPPDQLPQVEQLLTRVSVAAPERSQRAPFLEPLIAAAQQERWVRVIYHSVTGISAQHLLPRQVTTENGLWYCRAYAREHAEERTYRVDRFVSMEPANAAVPPAAGRTDPGR